VPDDRPVRARYELDVTGAQIDDAEGTACSEKRSLSPDRNVGHCASGNWDPLQQNATRGRDLELFLSACGGAQNEEAIVV